MLTRRSILIGLGASACAPRFGPLEQAPPTPLALGWRLVPGDLFALLARIERRTPTRTELRSEEWTFRVVEVDRGIARIEARVTALGAGLTEEDLILDTPATPSPATELALGRDGRLHGVSDPSFVASLPHYALALALPTGPVALHDEWVDPIGTSAATLLPEALEPTVESHSALRAVTLVDGRAIATIETRARIETPGPRLALAGSAEWDLLDGRLISRSLEIRPSRLGESEGNPGVLAVHLTTPRA